MKRKGYTLIEVIVVLGILSICLLIIAPSVDSYEKKRLDKEMEYAIDGVVEFINGCKSYARNNNDKFMKIVIEERKIKLFENVKLVEEFSLPDSVKVKLLFQNKITIRIDKLGNLKTATTIDIYNSKEVKHITIKAVTGYVSEQKKGL
ncbi:MAG: type II secretion system protein [Clostridium sp.]|uniref:type II secretion system protein n=1 Tax=Clostridium sp. TaxID=1506 RepID=UPI0030643745